MKIAACLCLCLSTAAPAWAGEVARPRLVPGGGVALPAFGADSKSALLSAGSFSLGTVSAPLGGGEGGSLVGGFAAADAGGGLHLSSSLQGGGGVGVADMTASKEVAPWGFAGVAALSLGYQWTQSGAFSLNPAQMSVAGTAAEQGNDLSLSLSFTHDITPSFSLGGFAAASRGEDAVSQGNAGLHFGAGLGLKF